jgi:uncharacterized protein (DUF1330 family)
MEVSINPKPNQMSEVLKKIPKDREVVMLNLLRFNDVANYPRQQEDEPISGQEAYQIYASKAVAFLESVNASLVWSGSAKAALIAPEGEAWDKVLLVKYPSIQAFVSMVMNPDYQAITQHRTAALANARLIATLDD